MVRIARIVVPDVPHHVTVTRCGNVCAQSPDLTFLCIGETHAQAARRVKDLSLRATALAGLKASLTLLAACATLKNAKGDSTKPLTP